MRTEDLIVDLAGRVTPVRPLPPPGVRTIGWLVFATACAIAGVALIGARADVLVRLTQPDYLWMAMLALFTSVVGVVASLVLAIPGAERRPVLRVLTLGLLGLWTATTAWAVLSGGRPIPFSTDPHWPVCLLRVVLVGAVPAVLLFVMLRRGVALRPGWTAAMAAAAAASVGALVVQLVCPIDDPGHGFLGHFSPVMLMIAIGVAAQRTLAR